jgi:hypothetical protein
MAEAVMKERKRSRRRGSGAAQCHAAGFAVCDVTLNEPSGFEMTHF